MIKTDKGDIGKENDRKSVSDLSEVLIVKFKYYQNFPTVQLLNRTKLKCMKFPEKMQF